MIKKMTINSTTWTAITAAGQQGTCWIYANKKGTGGLLINHSDSGKPKKNIGFRLYKPNDNTNICVLGPDNDNDRYYAKCKNSRESVIICVDVV